MVADRLFGMPAPRPQHVQADPPDDSREPAAEVVDRVGVGAAEPDPGLLDRVLGFGLGTQDPVRDRAEWSRFSSNRFASQSSPPIPTHPSSNCHTRRPGAVMGLTESSATCDRGVSDDGPGPPLEVRKQDTLNRLEKDVDAWVSTASLDGTPYLMPLSFLWSDGTLAAVDVTDQPDGAEPTGNPVIDLTLGELRDVIHEAGTVSVVQPSDCRGRRPSQLEGRALDPRPLSGLPVLRASHQHMDLEPGARSTRLKNRDLMDNSHLGIEGADAGVRRDG